MNTGTITDSYAAGSITGVSSVGGLVGMNGFWSLMEPSSPGTISNCYSAGQVTGADSVGGLVGRNEFGPIDNSFWDIQTSGQTTSAGATGKTAAEMKTAKTFLDAGWDFVGETKNGKDDIWTICEGKDYPRLMWQFTPGDFDGDEDVDVLDFAILAEHWLQSDSSFLWCRGADMTNDGLVGFEDLMVLAENWLRDIAP